MRRNQAASELTHSLCHLLSDRCGYLHAALAQQEGEDTPNCPANAQERD